jgi:hypothetical protein
MARPSHSVLPAVLALALLSACDTGDGRQLTDPVFDPPAPPATVADTAPPIVLTIPPLPESVAESTDPPTPTDAATPIEIETLFSPANATAEMSGTGAIATDAVTVDDDPADVLSFDVDTEGRFVLQVWIDHEGAHTVCVADACGRVYTLAADAESPEEVVAKIEQAIPLAKEYLDFSAEFAEWEITIGGALAGTGGTADVATKTVTVYRNRGRTVDDFVRTILHEFGHVADAERLDDAERAEYRAVRGIDTATPWRDDTAHRLDQWGLQPSEDFAEVLVAIWSDQRWLPRTAQLAPAPSADALAAVEALIAN